MVDATRFLGAWLRAGEGIGWLAAGTMPNSLYRMPLVYLFLTCVFCYSCSFLFVVCVFFLLSLELGRCSSDLFLSSRPRTGLATTYNNKPLTALCDRLLLFVYFQVNNGVVYLDYEDSRHHGPLLCSFQLLYRICLYCLMMYWFVFPFVGVPAWRLM